MGKFGTYRVNFSKKADSTLAEVFGTGDLKPSDMVKAIWKFIKENNLTNK